MNWNMWLRQFHRWVSIAFTVAVIINVIAVMRGVHADWIGFLALLPLFLLLFSGLYLFALPATEIYRTQKPFADAVKQQIGAAFDRVALYRTREIVHYLDAQAPIAEVHTPEELRRASEIRWVILHRRDWERLGMAGQVLVTETVYSWECVETEGTKLMMVEIDRR